MDMNPGWRRARVQREREREKQPQEKEEKRKEVPCTFACGAPESKRSRSTEAQSRTGDRVEAGSRSQRLTMKTAATIIRQRLRGNGDRYRAKIGGRFVA